MLEKLIKEYLQAKKRHENVVKQGMIVRMAAQSDYGEAIDRLLEFIEKHSDTLIAWEREHAVHLSPFDES